MATVFSGDDLGRVDASGPFFRIRYEGGDADNHVIDMRQLGESLQGIDRIISDGLIAIINTRVPKKGERAPLILKAKEPVTGSYEITGFLGEIAPLLAIGIPLITACGQDVIVDWMKSVVYKFSGSKAESQDAMQAIADNTRDHLLARDRSEERAHELQMRQMDVLSQTIDKLGAAAAQAAAPVGRSVRSLDFATPKREPFRIDEPSADLLRASDELEWGPLQTLALKTDGFAFHTGKLSVEYPDRLGSYLPAEVKDPLFKQESNPYTMAANRKALISVQGKPGYRAGRLERLIVMDFGGIIEEPS